MQKYLNALAISLKMPALKRTMMVDELKYEGDRIPFMHLESAGIHQAALPLFEELDDSATFEYEIMQKNHRSIWALSPPQCGAKA